MQVHLYNLPSIEYQNIKKINCNLNSLNQHTNTKVKFSGNNPTTDFIGHTNIRKINSDEEFYSVLSGLKNDKSWLKGWWDYPNATKFEQAIVPYIDREGISALINGYMRCGSIPNIRFSEHIIRDYIRAISFALTKIDEEYGKYEGIVYRCGHMDNVTKNFISTACDPTGVKSVITSKRDYREPFFIIYTKNGHKILDIQKKLGSYYAMEHEILIDPNTNFEEITNITPEMLELKHNLKKSIRIDEYVVPELNVTFLREI